MKIRVIPETNSSSSHALVFSPFFTHNVMNGIELITYFINFMGELYDEKASKEFKDYLLKDPRIQEELKKHPEFRIVEDVYIGIDSYSIPTIWNYTPKDEKDLIFRLYKEVIIEGIKNNWGVELIRESQHSNTNIPWLAALVGGGRIEIYRNGNYTTYILWRSTHERVIYSKIKILDEGETEYITTIPESIDLKITNKCYAMCPFCHENSTPDGEHASYDDVQHLTKALMKHPVPEIAIGGGNPLLHPDLEKIINNLRPTSSVAITARDIDYIEYGAPHGVIGYGISLTTPTNLAKLFELDIIQEYPVIHVINGVHKTEEVAKALRIYIERGPERFVPAVLILGFKTFGRGVTWKVRNTIDVKALMKKYPNVVYAFDDLAVKQLNIKNIVPKREWELFYNGEDGKRTMYIDLVKKQYARNSYSKERYNIEEWNIRKMFEKVKKS